MVYTFKLVNPLASCNHIGGNDMDLLMEAVVSTPAETPASSLGNGDLSTQAAGGDHRSGDGGVGGAPTGANGGGAGASAGTSSSQQQPPTSDNEEVDDISSDDEDDDDDVDHDGGGDGGDKDEDSVVSDDADALIGTLHQPGGTEPRSTAAGGVAGGVGDGVRADGAAAVMTSSGAKELDQPGGRMDLSPQGAESSGGVEHEAEGSQGGPAAATPAAAPLSTEPPQAQQQQETLVVDWSSEDETITKARTERREQPESPTATQLPGLSRPGDRAGRPRTGASPPPPSPPASPARSSSSNSRPSSPESVGSKQPAKSVGDDSDSTFDGSDENSSASESEVDGWDSDEHERDFPPPPCFLHHKDRPTYKQALCWECYNEYVRTEWVKCSESISILVAPVCLFLNDLPFFLC